MNRNKGMAVIAFVLIGLMGGCRAEAYDHNALCADRNVAYCEDFETVSSQFSSTSLSGSEWYVTTDHWLSYWSEELPADGRSSESFGSVGFESHYLANSETLLTTPSIDLSSTSDAVLRFNLMFLTEPKWDGMILLATPDQGRSWIYLEPLGEYPGTVRVGRSIAPGYSGLQPYWSHEEVDLNQFLGEEVSIGFLFLADDSINNIGVAVDDIVIQMKSKGFAAQSDFKFEFPDINQIIPQAPLISESIPKAIAIVDTPCEGEEQGVLKASQIAFTKAISPSGGNYLILHPDNGDLCWVSREDVWIDGQEGDLVVVSDLSKEDKYLPFCSLHHTPELDEPACLNSMDVAGGELTYHLSRVLIDNGRISTILIDPGLGVDPSLEEYDPRIGTSDAFPLYEQAQLAEGNLTININDQGVSCLIDSMNPGRVVCDDLALDSAESHRLDLCWTGWDTSQSCPPGHCSLTDGAGCYLIGDSQTCSFECLQGYQYSDELQVCLIDRDPANLSNSPELCPEGYKLNKDVGCCLTPRIEDHFDCPDGFIYLELQGNCQRMVEGGECPEGFIFHQDTGTCSETLESLAPICSGFTIEFPGTLITVRNATSCRKGPGRDFENVSSLSPFSEVEVLGVDEGKEFLIIDNPKYQIPCWAELDDFYADKLNMEILPVISIDSAED